MIENTNNRLKLDVMNTIYILNLNLITSDVTLHRNIRILTTINLGII